MKMKEHQKNLSGLLSTNIGASLIHADLWCNNIMHNDSGEMVFLDFQFLAQGDPCFCLGICIFMNTDAPSQDKSRKKIDQLLNTYFTTFKSKLDEFGVKIEEEDKTLKSFNNGWGNQEVNALGNRILTSYFRDNSIIFLLKNVFNWKSMTPMLN